MNTIVNDLLALIEDEGTRILESDDIIKEYIIAHISELAEEIRVELDGIISR